MEKSPSVGNQSDFVLNEINIVQFPVTPQQN